MYITSVRNLSLNDETQSAILPHLEVTERLLAHAASKASGKDRGADVIALSDLCFADNASRMLGGFYTGGVYTWESDAPMVPVDTTMNSCGVSLFSLRHAIDTRDEFNRRIVDAIERTSENRPYVWNFGTGNHFVTYGTIDGKPHLMMHSSAGEYKKQLDRGLYPVEGNWFYHGIKKIEDESTSRFLRYIDGHLAESFISTARSLEDFNAERHRFFAGAIAGDSNVQEEISNEQHYGMPTENSAAIGCQWKRKDIQILLTAPDKPIYLIEPEAGGKNDVSIGDANHVLFPHGLGKKATIGPVIEYRPDALSINGVVYDAKGSLRKKAAGFELRNFDESEAAEGKVPAIIAEILKVCPGKIRGTFQQVFGYHAKSGHPHTS